MDYEECEFFDSPVCATADIGGQGGESMHDSKPLNTA